MLSPLLLALFQSPVAVQQPVIVEPAEARPAEARPAEARPDGGVPAVFTWADIDGDGRLDAFALPPSGIGRLLHSRADGTFEDRTQIAGLDGMPAAERAWWVDVDGDGRYDLVLSGVACGVRIARQIGDGVFEDVTASSGLAGIEAAHGVRTLDYDGDGLFDLEIATPDAVEIWHNVGGQFTLVQSTARIETAVFVAPPPPSAETPVVGSTPERRTLSLERTLLERRPAARVPLDDSRLDVRRPAPPGGIEFTSTCPQSVMDFSAAGSCLNASTVPTMGMLYPLSEDLFVDSTGQIGAGTTTPLGRVHIVDNALLLPASALYSDDVVIEDLNAILGLYSNSVGNFGSGIVLGEVVGGSLVDKWAMVRRTESSALSGLDFTFGTSPLYHVNPRVMRLTPNLRVEIGPVASEALRMWPDNIESPSLLLWKTDTFAVNGGELLVDSAARVGIHEADPLTRLHVSGNGGNVTQNQIDREDVLVEDLDAVLALYSSGSVGLGSGLVLGSSLDKWAIVREAALDGNLEFRFGSNTTVASNPAMMLLTDDGKLGVSEVAPLVKLHVENQGIGLQAADVVGEEVVIEASDAVLGIYSSGTGAWGSAITLGEGSGTGVVDKWTMMRSTSGQNSKLVFMHGTNPSYWQNDVHMTLTSQGRLGIGTQNPGFDLEVVGNAGKPGGGSWSTASDRRLKRDIRDLEGSLEQLLALRGVTFEYLDPESIHETAGERVGMIAQEVRKVFPDWVHEAQDGYLRLTFSGFEALTVEALRELREEKDAEIEGLRREHGREIDALAHRLALLEEVLPALRK